MISKNIYLILEFIHSKGDCVSKEELILEFQTRLSLRALNSCLLSSTYADQVKKEYDLQKGDVIKITSKGKEALREYAKINKIY